MATSQQTGRVYYLNSKTGGISYELPSMPALTKEDEIAEVRPDSCRPPPTGLVTLLSHHCHSSAFLAFCLLCTRTILI
jgi:hypothetical protein